MYRENYEEREERLQMRRKTWGRILLSILATLVIVVTSSIVGCVGCTNAKTPAGHEGYVSSVPVMFGKVYFDKAQRGPTSTGLTWRRFVDNIDMRPQTYSEPYGILTKDNLSLTFKSHARISLRGGTVRNVVENFGAKNWFKKNVQQQYRAAVREEVRKYDAYDVKGKSREIAANILKRLKKQYKKTPVAFSTMSIGNIDYPDDVNKEIEKKLAATQKLQRKDIEEEIADKDAKIRVAKARGLADAQRIINKTLTPLYVQHEAIDAYRELAESPNTTFIIAPTNAKGTGMPMILGAK